MGMFSYIKCKKELPLTDELKNLSVKWGEVQYQTKDLDNCLETYIISEDGELLEEVILTQLNLLWGVRAFFYDKFTSTDDTIDDINKICKDKKYVNKGDMVINLASMPIANKGMVNTLRISEIE